MLPIADYLFLSFALLLIGVVGAATRRSLIIKLFSIELILNAAAINLMAFARYFAEANGEAFAGFTIAIVVAQVLVALAIIAAVFTRWLNLSPAKPPAQNPEQVRQRNLIILTTITAFALMPTHALESVRDFMHAEGAAFLPELELLLFACGILAMDFWISQKEKYWSPALALAGLLFSALTLWMLRARIAAGAEFAAVHDTILVDTYFLFFSALLLGASAMIILLSVNETAISLSRKARYYALLLFACAALMLAVSAVDLLVMFLALEVAALSCFFLTALPGISKRPESLSVKFMLSSLFGSAILIYGFSLLYGLSGATNIGKIASALARRHNVAKVIALSQQSGSHGAQMYQLLQSRLPEALHWHPFMLETLPMAAFLLVLFGLLAKIKAASAHHVDDKFHFRIATYSRAVSFRRSGHRRCRRVVRLTLTFSRTLRTSGGASSQRLAVAFIACWRGCLPSAENFRRHSRLRFSRSIRLSILLALLPATKRP